MGNIVKLRNELVQLRAQIEGLKKENYQLKKHIKLQEPLVKIGVSIRQRFLDKALEVHRIGQALEIVVQSGNRSAHRGEFLADQSMFRLGYMTAPDSSGTDKKVANLCFENERKKLFKELYSYDWTFNKLFTPKMLELVNNAATIRSCPSSINGSYSEKIDHGRFVELIPKLSAL